jgi:hypothetical protein
MRKVRIVVTIAVLAGVATGLAGPAAAEPLNGAYTATVVDGGGLIKKGVSKVWTFAPCGPDCTHFDNGTMSTDLHQQGASFNGTLGHEEVSVDPSALTATTVFSAGSTVVWSLAKNG